MLSQELKQDAISFVESALVPLNFQNNLQQLIAKTGMSNAKVYSKANIDRKFFSKIISTKNYIPKKQVVMALGLALELPLEQYEEFLASAGYALIPSNKFDLLVKYCVIHKKFNLIEVNFCLWECGLPFFL